MNQDSPSVFPPKILPIRLCDLAGKLTLSQITSGKVSSLIVFKARFQ